MTPKAIGFSSRHLASKFVVDTDPEKALAFLEGLGNGGGGMLLPTNDHYLILVSKNHERLSRSFVLTTPPWEILAPLMDIARCYRMAREVGVGTPEFYRPPRSYPDGVAWIWLTSYLETLWNNRSDRELRRELLALWKSRRRIRAVAFLDRGDLRPFLVSLWRCAGESWRYRVSGLRRRLGMGTPSLGPGEGEKAPG